MGYSKTKGKFIRFNVSISENTFNALDEFCSDFQLSRSSAINFAIQKLIKDRAMEMQLHEDITKLTDCLVGFSNVYGSNFDSTQAKELDEILSYCEAIKKPMG